jgi:hypothetical protein
MKPRIGQSSKGVQIIGRSALNLISNEYIVEELIKGIDISVDGYVDEAEVYFTCYCEKQKYKNTFIDKILYAESHVPVTLKTIINEIIENLGVKNVFFHIEFILCETVYYVVEFTLRGGGSGLSTVIASHTSGKNTIETRINILLGLLTTTSNESLNKYAIMNFGNENELNILARKLKNIIPEVMVEMQTMTVPSETCKMNSSTDRDACAYFFMDNKKCFQMAKKITQNY